MFCLYFDAATQKVSALNGSGRSGAKCTLERIRESLGIPDGETGSIPMTSIHAVTVPGAAAGWEDTVERFGSGNLTLEQILAPAVELGEKGFPVSELTAYFVSAERQVPSSPRRLGRADVDSNARSGSARKSKYGGRRPTLPRYSRTTRRRPTASGPRWPATS